jgi:SAM-dependent methyltransferase
VHNLLTNVQRILSRSKPAMPQQQMRLAELDCETWYIDAYEVDRHFLQITGACITPETIRNPKFLLNGQPFDQVEFPIEPEILGSSISIGRRLKRSRFRCIKTNSDTLFHDRFAKLDFRFEGQNFRYPDQYSWYILDDHLQPAFPSEQQIYRVSGTRSVSDFALSGSSAFKKLDSVVSHIFEKNLNSFKNILDWGCGCGRVTRYFSLDKGATMFGADIDHDSINWCRDNLTFGTFDPLNPFPPSHYQSNSFDLIYGISVFTHLRQNVQDAWLEELRRIATPGGLLLMTIFGVAALALNDLPQSYVQWLNDKIGTDGFVITAENQQIDEVVGDKSYYVDVFHSHEYIRKHWGRYFDIVDIIPTFLYTHDLVVMRKR